jgi:hypothetical protein
VLFSGGDSLGKVLAEGNGHIVEGCLIDCRPTMLREELRGGGVNDSSLNLASEGSNNNPKTMEAI